VSIDLAGKTALVTGASRGIGRAIALAYADAGADVALLARDVEKLEDVAAGVRAAGRRALVVPCDVTDEGAVQAAVATVLEELDHLDVVVNNAGGNNFSAPFVGMRMSGFDKVLRLNLSSTAYVCQAVGPHLVERASGSVINVASVAGLRGTPFMAHYGASKAAVLSLTRTLAMEWAWAGVRVNALLPGWVETDLTDFARADAGMEKMLIGDVPMQRWATPEEIAGPAVFLGSDASAFMTGQQLVIDGGLTAGS
jgi:NAD(P)-dependent dehydrogenase (short-subunit alcohol dehydrogenase family)